MKTNYTHISLVLDRSGSIQSVKSDMEGALNKFIEDQQKLPGECTLSLYQFDDQIDVIYEFQDMLLSGKISITPRGYTSLHDAMARAILGTQSYIENMEEDSKPERVIVVTITDGLENSSKEFNSEKIKEMVGNLEKQNWQFIFLGADQDAVMTAESLGVKSANSLTFNKNVRGIAAASASLTKAAYNYRSASLSSYVTLDAFDASDIKAQTETETKTNV